MRVTFLLHFAFCMVVCLGYNHFCDVLYSHSPSYSASPKLDHVPNPLLMLASPNMSQLWNLKKPLKYG